MANVNISPSELVVQPNNPSSLPGKNVVTGISADDNMETKVT